MLVEVDEMEYEQIIVVIVDDIDEVVVELIDAIIITNMQEIDNDELKLLDELRAVEVLIIEVLDNDDVE